MVANKPIDRSKGGGTADRRGLIKYELLEKLFLIPLYILFYYHRCTAHGPTRMGAFIDQRCCRCLCCGQSGQQFFPKGLFEVPYVTLPARVFPCTVWLRTRFCAPSIDMQDNVASAINDLCYILLPFMRAECGEPRPRSTHLHILIGVNKRQ